MSQQIFAAGMRYNHFSDIELMWLYLSFSFSLAVSLEKGRRVGGGELDQHMVPPGIGARLCNSLKGWLKQEMGSTARFVFLYFNINGLYCTLICCTVLSTQYIVLYCSILHCRYISISSSMNYLIFFINQFSKAILTTQQLV